MKYRSINDLTLLIDNKLHLFHQLKITAIVGIPRSGMLAGSILALKLNLPLLSLDDWLNGEKGKHGKTRSLRNLDKEPHFLIIDDSINSGKSYLEALEKIKKHNMSNYSTCAIYSSIPNCNIVDHILEVLPLPRFFEWNMFHSRLVQKTMYDIDGVLCLDPTKKQQSSPALYNEFLRNAIPNILYTGEAYGITTSRLLTDKEQTETWLKRYGLKYKSINFSKYNTVDDRRNANDHGIQKGIIYKNSSAELFVESEKKQAIDIVKCSGKFVFCTENSFLYGPNNIGISGYSARGRFTILKNFLKGYKVIVKLYQRFK
uniref:WpaI n=1 Tax=Providencia alcalifaciens TaxID=126385 RepID=M9P0Q3_9GAMM|nr:WpaI [Providencia alcalifaciens]